MFVIDILNKIFFIFLLTSLKINGYAYKTHSFLGNYLENYLNKYHNNVYIKVKDLIHNESFYNISTWADKIKQNNNYKWSKPLHYIDIDINFCNKSLSTDFDIYCNNNCIYTGILNMTNDLKYNNNYDINDYEKFKFLIHFLQDLNQPMHLLGIYRGGNDYHLEIEKDGKIHKSNLHTFWDSIIPEFYLHNYNYTYSNLKNYKNISSIFDYNNLLKLILLNNFNTTCQLPISKYIVFKKYFNKVIVESLFDNYMTISLHTLFYLFN